MSAYQRMASHSSDPKLLATGDAWPLTFQVLRVLRRRYLGRPENRLIGVSEMLRRQRGYVMLIRSPGSSRSFHAVDITNDLIRYLQKHGSTNRCRTDENLGGFPFPVQPSACHSDLVLFFKADVVDSIFRAIS